MSYELADISRWFKPPQEGFDIDVAILYGQLSFQWQFVALGYLFLGYGDKRDYVIIHRASLKSIGIVISVATCTGGMGKVLDAVQEGNHPRSTETSTTELVIFVPIWSEK